METVNSDMNQNELLAALQESLEQAAEGPDGAMTTEDICWELDISKHQARRMLKRLKRDGRLRVVTVTRPALDDQPRPHKAYQMLPESEDGAV